LTTSLHRPELHRPEVRSISRDRVDVHPGIDLPLLHDLLHPDRDLWTPRQLRDLTATVASELTTPLLDLLRFDGERRWWGRLALTEGVELWLLSWLPDQHTEPHDHGGAGGSFTVLLGELTEDYRYPGGPIRSDRRPVGATLGFGAGRAHQIRNQGLRGAASVHAYSPPLVPTREYRSLADIPAVIPPLPPTRLPLAELRRRADEEDGGWAGQERGQRYRRAGDTPGTVAPVPPTARVGSPAALPAQERR
jgi:hypothetical protein